MDKRNSIFIMTLISFFFWLFLFANTDRDLFASYTWELWFMPMLGLLMYALMLHFFSKRQKSLEYLKEYGISYVARVTDVSKDEETQSYYITATYTDAFREGASVFKSEPLPFDPTPFLQSQTILVYVHPRKKSKYYVDTSFLLKT